MPDFPRAIADSGNGIVDAASSLLSSGRTLSVHMYALSSEALHTDQAYATAVVLLIMVVGINALSAAIAKKIAKG